MRALYGEGLHPNADRIMGYAAGSGLPPRQALTASRLGRKFLVRDGEPEFARRLAVAYRDHNAEAGEHWNATIAADVRAQHPHPCGRESVQRRVRPPPGRRSGALGFHRAQHPGPHHGRRRL